jgi:acyl-CoA synthetase (AMP-forming)/AMP-acid ligase II
MGVEATTVPALLRHRAVESPDRPALVHDEDSITYRALDARSRALAARLVAAGVGKRSRVGVLMPNGIDWATVAYASLRVGAILVPLSTLLRPPELEVQLRSASVAFLVTTRAYRGRDFLADLASLDPGLRELGASRLRHARLPALRHVWNADALPSSIAPLARIEALEAVVRPADDLAILFTSGSRGAPKGVLHTHGNALRAVASGLDARCVGRGERLYIPMPFFWTGGFGGGLLTALVAGATLLTESDPSPARTIAFLERERATLFRGWPDQGAKVAADPSFETADLSSLRAGSLDAVLPKPLRARPGARANLFGMTETFGPYCGSRLDVDLPTEKFGSCGRPFDGVEVRIADPESGEPLERGRQGEIELRGPSLMRGISGRLRESTFTRDGFYRSGDLGILDADGYLFYAGRADDMFKVSGATVYPAEVEAALRAIPGVTQAYVTNVAGPTGELVGAAVVTREPMTVAELDREVRARLSSFKVPRRWALLRSPADVPTMATGKVDKTGLQELLQSAGEGSGPLPPSQGPTEAS